MGTPGRDAGPVHICPLPPHRAGDRIQQLRFSVVDGRHRESFPYLPSPILLRSGFPYFNPSSSSTSPPPSRLPFPFPPTITQILTYHAMPFQVIAKQITYSGIISPPPSPSIRQTWTDFLFEESRRRLATVYRVVNMLVYFEPAALCDLQSDLLLAPLPCHKNLWEAGTEMEMGGGGAEGERREGCSVWTCNR